MRWPPVGTSVSLHKVVSHDDRAAFADEDVHDVYGTVALVRDVEQLGRWLFRRCLEPGEEGVGAAIDVRQQRPVPVGATVDLVATVTHAEGRRMVVDVQVIAEGALAARASFTQVLIDPSRW